MGFSAFRNEQARPRGLGRLRLLAGGERLHPELSVLCLLQAAFPRGPGLLQRTMDSGARPVGGSCSSPAALSREYKLVMLGAGGVGKSGR